MANGQQKAEEYVRNFQIWASTQTDADFTRIIYRGQLNRGEVAKAIGCGKSALTQNPQLRTDLHQLEETLREKGVLPSLTQAAKANEKIPKEYDQTVNRNILDSQQKSKLEVENIELKAKLVELEKKLKRFGELSETLSEMGMLPR
jgi:uncharacterized protein YjgD (DUF1641 family)|tara:strand:- start:15095 stop:15532 length:438 start_codon:yes stop_codon:yes gene_type:complete